MSKFDSDSPTCFEKLLVMKLFKCMFSKGTTPILPLSSSFPGKIREIEAVSF